MNLDGNASIEGRYFIYCCNIDCVKTMQTIRVINVRSMGDYSFTVVSKVYEIRHICSRDGGDVCEQDSDGSINLYIPGTIKNDRSEGINGSKNAAFCPCGDPIRDCIGSSDVNKEFSRSFVFLHCYKSVSMQMFLCLCSNLQWGGRKSCFVRDTLAAVYFPSYFELSSKQYRRYRINSKALDTILNKNYNTNG